MDTARQRRLINFYVSYRVHQQISQFVCRVLSGSCHTADTHIYERLISREELGAAFTGYPHHFGHLNQHAACQFKGKEIIHASGINIRLVVRIHVLIHTSDGHTGLVFFYRQQGFYGKYRLNGFPECIRFVCRYLGVDLGAGKPITCALNPCVGREREMTLAKIQKRIMVVGGGPAGLYAAWACAVRGHKVTLFEKNRELGGSFRIASYPTGKGQISAAIRAMIVRCKNVGVEIRLNTEATLESIHLNEPDAVVVATGSIPLRPPIPGLSDCGCITAQDMLEGKAEIGKNVLVAGGGMIGCEAAEYLAERGHQVTIVEMKSVIAEDVVPEHKRYMFENFERIHVKLYSTAQITQFYQDGVSCIIKDGEPIALRGYDTILLAMGTRAFNPVSYTHLTLPTKA